MYNLVVSTGVGLFLVVLLNVCAPQPALAVTCGNNRSHNAFFGHRQPFDQLLFEDHPKLNFHFMRVVTYDIHYPNRTGAHVITYIEAIDQYTDNNGGCVMLMGGGVGTDNAQLHLKSQRNYGLDFVVRIFGVRSM